MKSNFIIAIVCATLLGGITGFRLALPKHKPVVAAPRS